MGTRKCYSSYSLCRVVSRWLQLLSKHCTPVVHQTINSSTMRSHKRQKLQEEADAGPLTDGLANESGTVALPSSCLCPVCQEIFCDPLRTPCGHAFCGNCLDRLFVVTRQGDSGPIRDRTRDCPLCRKAFQLRSCQADHALAAEVQRAYPAAYAQRKQSLDQETKDLQETGIHHLVLRIGNKYLLLPNAKSLRHSWELFVALEEGIDDARYLQQVVFTFLPPSRLRPVRQIETPFVHKARSDNAVEVEAEITFQQEFNQRPLKLHWKLDFSEDGGFHDHNLELQKGGLRPDPSRQHGVQGLFQGDNAALQLFDRFFTEAVENSEEDVSWTPDEQELIESDAEWPPVDEAP